MLEQGMISIKYCRQLPGLATGLDSNSPASTGTVSQLLLVKSPSLPVKSIAETPKSCYIAFLLPWLGHNLYSSIHAMPH